MNTEQRTVILCGERVTYSFIRKKIKRVNLRVKADLSVTVSAPVSFSAARADEFVISHEKFVINNLKKFSSDNWKKNVQPSFASGEKISVFGALYTLRFLRGKNKVMFSGGDILIFTPNALAEEAEAAFNKFVYSECKRVFTELLTRYYPYFKRYVGEFPYLILRSMKTAWGTCNPKKNKITLNLKLFYKPMAAVEYVVVHEYCHYIQLNHSPAFYAEVAKIMPDYKERALLLKNKR